MQIRPARPEDLASLEALFEQVDAHHRERLPERFRAGTGPARSHDHLLGLIHDPASAVLLADEAGDALGFVQLAVRDTPALPLFVPRRFAVIDNLVVAAHARRRGVGRALMAEADAWARGRGASTTELSVYAINDEAIAFYRALGYHVISYRMSRDVAAPPVS